MVQSRITCDFIVIKDCRKGPIILWHRRKPNRRCFCFKSHSISLSLQKKNTFNFSYLNRTNQVTDMLFIYSKFNLVRKQCCMPWFAPRPFNCAFMCSWPAHRSSSTMWILTRTPWLKKFPSNRKGDSGDYFLSCHESLKKISFMIWTVYICIPNVEWIRCNVFSCLLICSS